MKKILVLMLVLALFISIAGCSDNSGDSITETVTETSAKTETPTPKPTEEPTPSPTPEPVTFVDVVAENYLAAAIMSDGSVRTKGLCKYGMGTVSQLSGIKDIELIISSSDEKYYCKCF